MIFKICPKKSGHLFCKQELQHLTEWCCCCFFFLCSRCSFISKWTMSVFSFDKMLHQQKYFRWRCCCCTIFFATASVYKYLELNSSNCCNVVFFFFFLKSYVHVWTWLIFIQADSLDATWCFLLTCLRSLRSTWNNNFLYLFCCFASTI